VDRTIALGERSTVRLDHVDCGGESVKLTLIVDPPGPVQIRLLADGARLEILEQEWDEASGRVRVTAYPLLRAHGVLQVELKGRGRGAEAALDVRLP
jgi:hypothetical protein